MVIYTYKRPIEYTATSHIQISSEQYLVELNTSITFYNGLLINEFR